MTGEQLNTTYSVSTADIPQTSTLRLHTKMDQNESLGVDEARTAFNGDQVSSGLLMEILKRLKVNNLIY